MKELKENGYIYITNFFDHASCDSIVEEYRKVGQNKLLQFSLNLNDSDDLVNKIYKSYRSPMQYCYLESDVAQELNSKGKFKLEKLTGMSWSGNINERVFPIFEYFEGGFIKAHRGRNVGYGENDFVAVLMLFDYSKDYLGGEFYLNKNAEASEDGKKIFNEVKSDRLYFKQAKGSLIIFNNPVHVHGTLPVKESELGRSNRITTSWRMEAS